MAMGWRTWIDSLKAIRPLGRFSVEQSYLENLDFISIPFPLPLPLQNNPHRPFASKYKFMFPTHLFPSVLIPCSSHCPKFQGEIQVMLNLTPPYTGARVPTLTRLTKALACLHALQYLKPSWG